MQVVPSKTKHSSGKEAAWRCKRSVHRIHNNSSNNSSNNITTTTTTITTTTTTTTATATATATTTTTTTITTTTTNNNKHNDKSVWFRGWGALSAAGLSSPPTEPSATWGALPV